MKKFILLILATPFCLPGAVYAASIGGVETQGQGKFSVGLDQEFVFDRDGKDKTLEDGGAYSGTATMLISGAETFIDLNIEGVTGNQKIESKIDRMSRSMLKVSYGVFDNLDVFAKLGEANLRWKSKGETPDGGTFVDPEDGNLGTYAGTIESTGIFKGESAFAWGLGIHNVYPLANEWSFGIQAQYLRHKNTLKCSTTEKETGAYEVTAGPETGDTGTFETAESTSEWNAKATVQEWQIAPYFAKKIGSFIPYLGVKYSDQRIEYKDENGKIKFRADNNFGVFVGTGYKLGESWRLNLEGRFIDETAMSFACIFKF